MKKTILTLSLLCVFIMCLNAQKQYDCTTSVTINKRNDTLTQYSLVIPAPRSCLYQEVSNLESATGVIRQVANSENLYMWDYGTMTGNNHTLSESYSVTLYPMYIDMSQFETLYPYDTNSEVYKRYTANKEPYIDTNNATIRQISQQLWNQADGSAIEYARLCYEYIGKNYSYKNPNTGIHSIQDILTVGGGDCGNLASIFVNLLRAQKIPARHIVTVRPNNTWHVWADFYLQNYGWIPVDVDMKVENPNGDYFGYCKGDGIIMSDDICHNIYYDGTNQYLAVILQTYFYWYWGYNNVQANCTYKTQGTLTNSPKAPSVSVNDIGAIIKWNSFKGATGYRIDVYAKETNELVDVYTVGKEDQSLSLEGLSSKTDYHVYFFPLRKVDNVETSMGDYKLTFKTNNTTEIVGVKEVRVTSPVFNLHGQQVEERRKGIFIINGKMVITK